LRGGHYDRRRGRSGLPRGGETSRPERKSAASRIVLDSRLPIPRDYSVRHRRHSHNVHGAHVYEQPLLLYAVFFASATSSSTSPLHAGMCTCPGKRPLRRVGTSQTQKPAASSRVLLLRARRSWLPSVRCDWTHRWVAYVREQVVHLLRHDLARELPSHGAACAHAA
jgi:hypothetical protein